VITISLTICRTFRSWLRSIAACSVIHLLTHTRVMLTRVVPLLMLQLVRTVAEALTYKCPALFTVDNARELIK